MRRPWFYALLALTCLAAAATILSSPEDTSAQGWTSTNKLDGQEFNADWAIGVTDTMIRFGRPDSSRGWITAATAAVIGSTGHKWWFFSFSAPCTLDVFSMDCAGPLPGSNNVQVLSHATGAGSITLPGFAHGIDSVRVRNGGAPVNVVCWIMD